MSPVLTFFFNKELVLLDKWGGGGVKKTTDYAMNSSYCADELNISFVKKIVHMFLVKKT